MKKKQTSRLDSMKITDPEVQLEIDARIEEYEMALRRKINMQESDARENIEKQKNTFYQHILRNELNDIRKNVKQIREEERSIIGLNFWISVGISLVTIVVVLLLGDELAAMADRVSRFIATYLNWFYVLLSTSFLLFLVYLAFGRFGSVVLGPPNQRPEFDNLSWYAMLFSAGMGVGILFWGTAEPMSHLLNPPTGTPLSVEAAKLAMAYTSFHWGLHAWAIYALCAVGVAYYGFRKRKKYLISSSIVDITANPVARKYVKSTVDLLAILAVVFGVSASLGLGILQLSNGLDYVFGLQSSNAIGYILLTTLITFVFILSSATGLDKGIRWLSNGNMLIALALLLFVFFTSDTLFNLKIFVDSIGQYLSRLPRFSFMVEPFDPQFELWMGNWTLSYFTWWIAWAPFVGIFIARISKGRTIKELILGCLLIPCLFSILWFAVFGGTAIHLEMVEQARIGGPMLDNVALGTFIMFEELPLTKVSSLIGILLIFTFLVTSADSATYVISMMTSQGDLAPRLRIKVVWGILLGGICVTLLIGGGLKALQAATLIFAFPFSIVLILIARSFLLRLNIQVKKKRA